MAPTQKKNSLEHRENPLIRALAEAEAAIKAVGPPEQRVARALASLADGLARMVDSSDQQSSGSSRRSIAGDGALRRHDDSQAERIGEIRDLARKAGKPDASREELSTLTKAARGAANAACRTQVRKLRLRRRVREDAPGGQG